LLHERRSEAQEVRLSARIDLSEVRTGDSEENACPYGTVPLTKAECRHLSLRAHKKPHRPFLVVLSREPQGCYEFHRRLYYNAHPIGKGHQGRKLYCKRRETPLRFQKIQMGACTDYGFLPITRGTACEGAARALGLTDTTSQVIDSADRPEGCYYLANLSDSTGTLWLNLNAHSKGHGAQASTGPKSWTRHPICAAQTIPKTLPLTSKVGTTLPPLANYIAGSGEANECPYGSVPLDELECQRMPDFFGGRLQMPFVVHSPVNPGGCFAADDAFSYNVHTEGAGSKDARLYCRVSRSGAELQSVGSEDCGNACRLRAALRRATKQGVADA